MVDRGSLDFNKNLSHINNQIRAQAPVNRQTLLPSDFEPSTYDVICARGKAAWNHVGNRRFRVTIDIYFTRYKAANSKVAKSILVMEIVDVFRENSSRGGFVRQDSKSKRWFEVGDAIAREKVGQSLRELLLQQDPKRHSVKRSRKASLKKARRESEKKRRTALSPSAATALDVSPEDNWQGIDSDSSSISSTAFNELVHFAPVSPQQHKISMDDMHTVHRPAFNMHGMMQCRGVQCEAAPPVSWY